MHTDAVSLIDRSRLKLFKVLVRWGIPVHYPERGEQYFIIAIASEAEAQLAIHEAYRVRPPEAMLGIVYAKEIPLPDGVNIVSAMKLLSDFADHPVRIFLPPIDPERKIIPQEGIF